MTSPRVDTKRTILFDKPISRDDFEGLMRNWSMRMGVSFDVTDTSKILIRPTGGGEGSGVSLTRHGNGLTGVFFSGAKYDECKYAFHTVRNEEDRSLVSGIRVDLPEVHSIENLTKKQGRFLSDFREYGQAYVNSDLLRR